MEQAAEGGGGVTISGGVQKTYRCGTSVYGLVGVILLGGWLDLILEVFYNLWFYDYIYHAKWIVKFFLAFSFFRPEIKTDHVSTFCGVAAVRISWFKKNKQKTQQKTKPKIVNNT